MLNRPNNFALLPKEQRDLFVSTVLAANEHASAGWVMQGFRCLWAGLEEARVGEDEGETWAPILSWCFTRAMACYTERYGERLLAGAPED